VIAALILAAPEDPDALLKLHLSYGKASVKDATDKSGMICLDLLYKLVNSCLIWHSIVSFDSAILFYDTVNPNPEYAFVPPGHLPLLDSHLAVSQSPSVQHQLATVLQ
jgi:hypothetical protein